MAKVQDLASALGIVKDFAKYSKESGQSWSQIAQLAKSITGGGGTGNMGGSGVVANPNPGSFGNYMSRNGGFGSALTNFGLSLPGIVANALPSPAAAASYQLSTARQGFFGNQSFTSVASAQRGMASAGTGIDSMDAVRAITTLQNAGIYNTGAIGKGVAALSNYEPGLGLAGTAQAIGSMNQGRSVNMLNQIGVQVRGANGLMKDPNQIVNDFVDKIFQSTPPLRGGAADAYAYLIGWLQPGNQGYLILNTYFTDSNMRQLVVDKLFSRAKGLPGTPSKDQLISAGAMTKTTAAQSAYNASQLGLTQATQADINRGTTAALHNLTKATEEFAKVAHQMHLGYASGFGSTMMNGMNGSVGALGGAALATLGGPILKGIGKMGKGIFNFLKGTVGKLVKNPLTALEEGDIMDFGAIALEDLAVGGMMLAKGGPANRNLPYIVGEKGPELFIPDNNGTVIPNNVTQKLMRSGGGSVDAGGFASMLLGRLGAPQTAQNLSNVTMWEGMEGGNWHNTAHYNPLNTSYQTGKSVNFSTGKPGGGVQAYTSWEEGLNATVSTLTGASADARGYTNLVKLLRSGTATKADFLKAMQGSAWDAGHYKGGSSTSVSDSSSGGMYSTSSSPMTGFGGTAPGTVLGSVGGTTIGASSTVNVYVTVPASTDPKHVAATTKAVTDAVSKATGVKVDRTR